MKNKGVLQILFLFSTLFTMPQLLAQSKNDLQIRLKPQTSSPDIACIKRQGFIRVAIVDENYPPFVSMGEDGNYSGINITIAQRLANSMGGQPMYIVAKDTDEVVKLITLGKADMGIARLEFDEKYADRVHYTTGYAEVTRTFLINRSHLAKFKQSNQDTLRGFLNREIVSVGILSGSPNKSYLEQNIPNAKIIEFDTWQSLLESLIKGDISAGFRDEISTINIFKDNPNLALNLISVRLKEERLHYRMMLPWTSGGLLNWINAYLEKSQFFITADQLKDSYVAKG